jgi:squalene-associated FAD-dependent desaturase
MRVAVVGAGLAGLTAACALADAGQGVTLFEARPWAGGKTYSFEDHETGDTVDNGQHIFMTCCTAYIGLLRRLGTLRLTRRQQRLRVPVLDGKGMRSDLWSAPLPPPLHLAPAFALYRHLGCGSKWRIARAIAALRRVSVPDRAALGRQSFSQWLRRHGQTDAEISGFWDLIVVPALNCTSEQASAEQAFFLFERGFLASAESAAIGVPTTGLSDLHVRPAVRYLEARGGELRTSAAVERLELGDGRFAALVVSDTRSRFDACVLAVPPRQALAILPAALCGVEPFASLQQIRYAPILNLHCWFDGAVAPLDFVACIGSELQWVFNRSWDSGTIARGEHLVVSLSAAERFMELSRRELRERFLPELARVFPAVRRRTLRRFLAIKEPEATFLPVPGLRRPGAQTPIPNLVLAGAHTDTGWPATMESAVRSGLIAARVLLASA